VVDSLTSDSAIPGLVDGDADEVAGAVERNGPVVLLRAPLSGEPHTWARPLSLLDPALLIELGD
jgi:hypothetical protein